MKLSAPGYRNGLPFIPARLAQDGQPFQAWDGVTLYEDGTPSKSASQMITVYGPGSYFCLQMTLSQVMELVWQAKAFECTMPGLTALFSATGYSSSSGGSWVLPPDEDWKWEYDSDSASAAISSAQSDESVAIGQKADGTYVRVVPNGKWTYRRDVGIVQTISGSSLQVAKTEGSLVLGASTMPAYNNDALQNFHYTERSYNYGTNGNPRAVGCGASADTWAGFNFGNLGFGIIEVSPGEFWASAGSNPFNAEGHASAGATGSKARDDSPGIGVISDVCDQSDSVWFDANGGVDPDDPTSEISGIGIELQLKSGTIYGYRFGTIRSEFYDDPAKVDPDLVSASASCSYNPAATMLIKATEWWDYAA